MVDELPSCTDPQFFTPSSILGGAGWAHVQRNDYTLPSASGGAGKPSLRWLSLPAPYLEMNQMNPGTEPYWCLNTQKQLAFERNVL